MQSNKRLTFFLLQFPVCLLVGVLLSFAYSMRAHDQPSIDWLVALSLAIGLDVFFTWRNSREQKKQNGAG
jgi:membrane protein DedA with SNARE-associated domain